MYPERPWEVLDPHGRAAFRTALEVDDATWTKSRGWALLIALMTFPSSAKAPTAVSW